MELEGNCNAETSAAFLDLLMHRHSEQLNVVWDCAPSRPGAPARRGETGRKYLRTPGLRLVNHRLHEGRFCWATTPRRRSGAE